MANPSSSSEHDDFLEDGIPHVSVKEYVTGFVLSVVLTAIPFWLVMNVVIASAGMTGPGCVNELIGGEMAAF